MRAVGQRKVRSITSSASDVLQQAASTAWWKAWFKLPWSGPDVWRMQSLCPAPGCEK